MENRFSSQEKFKFAVRSKICIFYNLDKLFHCCAKLLKLATHRSSSILFLTHTAVPSCLLLPQAQPSFNTQPKVDAPAIPFGCGGSIKDDITRDDVVSCAGYHVNFSQNVCFLSFFYNTNQPVHHQHAEQQGTV